MGDSSILIRRANLTDTNAIIKVGTAALGWVPNEPNAELFCWKHFENPFGVSPIWLAEVDGKLAGYRALMQWKLIDAKGRRWRAVRAVDTATHPDYQRRGIFSTLTRHAVEEIATDEVDIVFNTPNSQSRPGYLKMGWIDVGRLPVAVRPTSARAAVRMLSAQSAANKWSEPCQVGIPAADVSHHSALHELVLSQPRASGLATALSAELLQWRYGLEALHYRAWAPSGPGEGVVFFRVRRRGLARECAVGHVLSPDGDGDRARSLVRGLSKAIKADYLLRLGSADIRGGFFPLPGQGPRLTARSVNDDPPSDASSWHLQLGDIELF